MHHLTWIRILLLLAALGVLVTLIVLQTTKREDEQEDWNMYMWICVLVLAIIVCVFVGLSLIPPKPEWCPPWAECIYDQQGRIVKQYDPITRDMQAQAEATRRANLQKRWDAEAALQESLRLRRRPLPALPTAATRPRPPPPSSRPRPPPPSSRPRPPPPPSPTVIPQAPPSTIPKPEPQRLPRA
uniref:Uncharacterized protein n=1 Tax=viral metagenome TaxID=1070528 RepID=A0A6C0BR39_9ZZZZ